MVRVKRTARMRVGGVIKTQLAKPQRRWDQIKPVDETRGFWSDCGKVRAWRARVRA